MRLSKTDLIRCARALEIIPETLAQRQEYIVRVREFFDPFEMRYIRRMIVENRLSIQAPISGFKEWCALKIDPSPVWTGMHTSFEGAVIKCIIDGQKKLEQTGKGQLENPAQNQ